MEQNQQISIGDIVICNDIIGVVTGETDKDLTICNKDGGYRMVSKNTQGLGLICSAYAHAALVYKKVMEGIN